MTPVAPGTIALEAQSLQSPDIALPTALRLQGLGGYGSGSGYPGSTQTLPREITFNAAARTMQQYPIEELMSLRKDAAFDQASC